MRIGRAAICTVEGTARGGVLLRARPRESRQAVVGDRLPRGRRLEELAVGRADAGVVVEDAEPDAADRAVRALTPQARAAQRAEHLDEAALARPRAQRLLAGQQP